MWGVFLSLSPHPKREQTGCGLGGGKLVTILSSAVGRFHLEVSVPPQQGRVCWWRAKAEVALGDITRCAPKLLWMRARGPEGQSLCQVWSRLLASPSLAGAWPTDFIATIICDT